MEFILSGTLRFLASLGMTEAKGSKRQLSISVFQIKLKL